jgi:hypothetical protein
LVVIAFADNAHGRDFDHTYQRGIVTKPTDMGVLQSPALRGSSGPANDPACIEYPAQNA